MHSRFRHAKGISRKMFSKGSSALQLVELEVRDGVWKHDANPFPSPVRLWELKAQGPRA